MDVLFDRVAALDIGKATVTVCVRTPGPRGKRVSEKAPGPGPRAARRADLTVEIKVAHDASDGVNGAPRVLADLGAAGEVVSVKTVAKLMRENDTRGISPRPWWPVTTITDPSPHAIPDLVERRFDRGALNLVWTS